MVNDDSDEDNDLDPSQHFIKQKFKNPSYRLMPQF